MAEIVLRRHRPRLLQRDAVEGCIAYDADLAVLEAEISSAGDSAAIAGAASSRKPAITVPIARRVIVPQGSIAHETSAMPGRFCIGNVDASRHGPGNDWGRDDD
jgi:phosphoribosylcarboxyaminoimidazole (NCAIR) mutase